MLQSSSSKHNILLEAAVDVFFDELESVPAAFFGVDFLDLFRFSRRSVRKLSSASPHRKDKSQRCEVSEIL
jgi:hypothetical protein